MFFAGDSIVSLLTAQIGKQAGGTTKNAHTNCANWISVAMVFFSV